MRNFRRKYNYKRGRRRHFKRKHRFTRRTGRKGFGKRSKRFNQYAIHKRMPRGLGSGIEVKEVTTAGMTHTFGKAVWTHLAYGL